MELKKGTKLGSMSSNDKSHSISNDKASTKSNDKLLYKKEESIPIKSSEKTQGKMIEKSIIKNSANLIDSSHAVASKYNDIFESDGSQNIKEFNKNYGNNPISNDTQYSELAELQKIAYVLIKIGSRMYNKSC